MYQGKRIKHNKNKLEGGKMKRKGLVVVLLCVMGLATISIGNVEAAAWYTCSVSLAGASISDAIVCLTDTAAAPAFPAATPFIIDNSTGRANQMLATALTAFANSTNVSVYLVSPAAWSTAPILYAVK
jgi:hypothetical protein